MKELTEKQVEDGVAALDTLRERIIPQSYRTAMGVFTELSKKYPQAVDVEQTLIWDEKNHWVTLANSAVDEDGKVLGPPINDTRPWPPCCPDCP